MAKKVFQLDNYDVEYEAQEIIEWLTKQLEGKPNRQIVVVETVDEELG